MTLNGRGRPTACLTVLTTSGSPRQTTKATITTHTRPRVPAFQTTIAPSTISNGTNQELPLKNGMIRSNSGLLNVRLMKRNSATSSDWSQCIAATVAWNAELKTELRGPENSQARKGHNERNSLSSIGWRRGPGRGGTLCED